MYGVEGRVTSPAGVATPPPHVGAAYAVPTSMQRLSPPCLSLLVGSGKEGKDGGDAQARPSTEAYCKPRFTVREVGSACG
jgi:hypothetical protein